MKKPKMKTFKDSVHGYIEIPQDYVENIIDTELFQRLRNIEQTGMRCLYPAIVVQLSRQKSKVFIMN